MRVTSPALAAEAEHEFHHRPNLTWPDDCHACATRMTFDHDAPVLRRVCPACGATAEVRDGRMILSPVPKP